MATSIRAYIWFATVLAAGLFVFALTTMRGCEQDNHSAQIEIVRYQTMAATASVACQCGSAVPR